MNQLYSLQAVFIAILLLLSGCTSKKAADSLTSTPTTELTLPTTIKPSLNLIEYPKAFLTAMELEEWEEFENLHESMVRLKELNFDGIEVDLLALSSRVKKMRSGALPKNLDVPQLKSRLKVVEMQVQKARYFTQHYKKDSLVPAIHLLYTYYNSFVSRMSSLQNEDQDFDIGVVTTTINQ